MRQKSPAVFVFLLIFCLAQHRSNSGHHRSSSHFLNRTQSSQICIFVAEKYASMKRVCQGRLCQIRELIYMSLSPLLSDPIGLPAAGNTTIQVTCDQIKNMHLALVYARIGRHCPERPASGGLSFLLLIVCHLLHIKLQTPIFRRPN